MIISFIGRVAVLVFAIITLKLVGRESDSEQKNDKNNRRVKQ